MLHELKKQDFNTVGELVNLVDHNRTVVEAVLQGNNAGRVFVDDISSPSAVLIYPQEMFMYLIAQSPSNLFLQQVHDLLFQDLNVKGIELFAFPELGQEQLHVLLGGRPHVKLVRKEYILDSIKFTDIRNSCKLPSTSEFCLRGIDADFFEAFPVDLIPGWTKDDFLVHGFGYSLVKDDELISQCVVGYRSTDAVELGVNTNEGYRRRGLALPVCAAVVEHALALGLHITWSCWEFNEASWRLGEKLGFVLANRKQLYLWDAWVQKKHDSEWENESE